MEMMRLGFALALALLASPSLAQTKTLWSIYWLSDVLPCKGYWGTPMTSAQWPCMVNGVAVSICPRPYFPYPFDQGRPITIVGYEIVQILTEPTAQGYMVVGSGHGGDGADVFAMTGGIGTNSKAGFFPPGIGIAQGKERSAHIDAYGFCTSGTQRAIVNIFYTSP